MNKILNYFIENKLIVSLLLLLIILAGIIGVTQLKQEVFPATDFDTLIVNIKYPGASPLDSEINAVIPAENEIKTISGIKDYVSLSIDNGAIIYIYLNQDLKNKQAVKDEVYRKLYSIPDISPDVESVDIINANPKRMPVYQIGLAFSDTNFQKKNQKSFYNFAYKFYNDLSKVKGVNEVRMTGYRNREIKISVDLNKMKKTYISLNDVINSIQHRNIRDTGGTLQSIHKEQNIVTIGQFKDPLNVKDVIIRSSYENKRILVKDIADVKDEFEDEEIKIRVNRKPGIVFGVVKNENADIVKTVKTVKTFLKKYKKKTPKIFQFTTIADSSLSIIALINVVKSNALIGFILILIILLVFLDARSAFWTAVGIPISISIVMIYMYVADISLNLISLGAIITVLGMLVDHGIVISENIFTYRTAGYSPQKAALLGVREVISPIVVTILTTIVAFLPLLYVKGKMGKFIKVYPIIVSVALIASFLEAILFLPSHLSHKTKRKINPKKWFDSVANIYKKSLYFFIKYKYWVLLSFVVLFIGTFFISQKTIKNYILFWDNTSDAFYINLEAPASTTLERTSELTSKIEKIVSKKIKKSEMIAMRTTIGNHTVKKINSKGNHYNWAQIAVYLVPKTQRKRSVENIIRILRKTINPKKIPYFKKILYAKQIIGPPPAEAINLKIGGGSEIERIKLQNNIEKKLKSIPGVLGFDDDQKPGTEEILLNFNYNKLAQYNMDVATVARTVRAAYEGVVATSIQTIQNELNFRVEIKPSFRRNKKFLLDLLIPNKQGRLIKLGDVASLKYGQSKSTINHYNGERVITISAKVDRKITTPTAVMTQLKEYFSKNLKKFPNQYIKFKGEAEETKETMHLLIIAFIIAVFAVYLILVILFKSVEQPFIILITVPFGLIGVLLAFTIHNIPLNFMGIVGIIGLTGVVVNDSVVMVDFINNLMKQNKTNLSSEKFTTLLIEGATKRLRPVLLTTLTTVFGLLPTAYGIGGDVRSLRPTVIALGYGILFTSILTLVLMPILYKISYDIKKRITQLH